jgi:CBS domain-containing protein
MHKVVIVPPETKVLEAARKMVKQGIGSVLVGEHHKVLGIVTDGDIFERFVVTGKLPDEVSVEEVMTRELCTIEPEENVEYALALMKRKKIKHLPVVSRGRLIGILSASDIAKHATEIGMDSWF